MTVIPMLRAAAPRFGRLLEIRRAGDFEFRLSDYDGSTVCPTHRHPDAYFCYVVRGGIDERAGEHDARFGPGSLHFHPAGEPHAARTGGAGLRSLSIVVRGRSGTELTAAPGPAPVFMAPAPGLFVARCWIAFFTRDRAAEVTLEGAAHELLAATCRPDSPRSAAPTWVSTVRDYLHVNFRAPVRLRDLAAFAKVHEVHIVRGFRRNVGVTPGVYLRRLRLDAARHALVATSDPIAAIAIDTGFYDQSHFTRVFHREVGAPPAVFRRLHAHDPRRRSAPRFRTS
jgi:AraC family transcriptional regulator